MAKRINTDGTEIELKDAKLKTLQEAVGGFIEHIRLSDNRVLVVNEEGLLLRLPVNPKASVIADMTIVGDVVLCKRKGSALE